MDYEGDPLLPMLTVEIEKRTEALMNLSPEEESTLLSLTAEQKRLVGENDKRAKQEYLSQQPNINNAGVKGHEKYRNYIDMVTSFNKTDV